MNGNKLHLYNFAECRQIDILSQQAGLPEKQLMGQAALASFYALKGYIEKKAKTVQRILIVCGPGNNGGDGLALAYLLLRSHHFRSIALGIFHSSGQVKSDAARFYWDLLQKKGHPLYNGQDFLKENLGANDLIIEALLGTGQTSQARGMILEILLHIRKYRSQSKFQSYPHLISLDLPAGLSEKNPADFLPKGFYPSSHSKDENYCLAAPDEIHSYGVDKLALRLSASLCAYSRIRVLDIAFLDSQESSLRKFRLSHFPDLYDERNKTYNALFRKESLGHKYTAGHALLIGSSLGMEGASLMASRAFFAAGGGILHVLLPETNSRFRLSEALPTVMFHNKASMNLQIKPSCILIGPGLREEDLIQMEDIIRELIKESQSQTYFLLDAAATKLIYKLEFPFPWKRTILLAHTGEWKALGGLSSVIKDTESLYANMDFYQKKIKGHILIKDSISVLLSPLKEKGKGSNEPRGAEGLLFSKPNPALSVAGSGDNLAGILLAMFARKARLVPNGIFNQQIRKTHESQEEEKNSQNGELQAKVLLGLSLLHQTVRGRIHPRSDEFASALEKLLSKNS